MLSHLFAKSKKKDANEVSLLFSRDITIKERKQEVEVEPQQETEPVDQIDLQTEKELDQEPKEDEMPRGERVVFVGNLEINTTNKDIQSLFKQYGEIEKIWFRSVPVSLDPEKKVPIKAAVIKKQFQEGARTKNCYILFEVKESATECLAQNGVIYKGFHLRVDLADHKQRDLTNTVFLGNLPFTVEEEDIRSAIQKQFGEVDYCRVIKDRISRKGKGFGYIKFKSFKSFKKAIEAAEFSFGGRNIRVTQAQYTKEMRNKDQVLNNSSNAFRRISSKRDVKGVMKEENRKLLNQKVNKKIRKIRSKNNVKPQDIKDQVTKIKQSLNKQQDSNIFNRQPVKSTKGKKNLKE